MKTVSAVYRPEGRSSTVEVTVKETVPSINIDFIDDSYCPYYIQDEGVEVKKQNIFLRYSSGSRLYEMENCVKCLKSAQSIDEKGLKDVANKLFYSDSSNF